MSTKLWFLFLFAWQNARANSDEVNNDKVHPHDQCNAGDKDTCSNENDAEQAYSYPRCNVVEDTCPLGMTCDLIFSRCYHEPRRLGEPCGPFLTDRYCSEYYLNTTRKLSCSDICGTCILEDQKEESMASHDTTPTLREVERCGLKSNVSFANWEGSIISTMPVMYPRNDEDLSYYLSVAADNNCSIRPVGATHTSSSVITSTEETTTVGISLAEYRTNNESWDMVLNFTTNTVRAPAGTSLFDLYQFIRPHGFFLPTQTAGPIFTLGGVVSNSVHGGVYNKGYMSEYATGLRVATWNGTEMQIKYIFTETELRLWRNSFGLLGVITAIEFVIEQRNHFVIENRNHAFEGSAWNRENVNAYFQSLADDYLYSETFFNPYLKEVNHVLFKTNVEAPQACLMIEDNTCDWDYLKTNCGNDECCQYKYTFGDMTLDESCRAIYRSPKSLSELQGYYANLQPSFDKVPFDGSPGLSEAKDAEVCILLQLDNRIDDSLLTRVFYDAAFHQVDSSCVQNSLDVNDGFWLRSAPHGIKLMAYSVPVENLFDLLTIIEQIFEEVSNIVGHKQIGNVEFRFLNISDTMVLNPTGAKTNQVKTGQHVNCEVVFNVFPDDPNHSWATSLYEFENRVRQFDAVVHTGKSFCYSKNSDGDIIPYGNTTCIKRIFNTQQKSEFNQYRYGIDPTLLFDGGASEEFF